MKRVLLIITLLWASVAADAQAQDECTADLVRITEIRTRVPAAGIDSASRFLIGTLLGDLGALGPAGIAAKASKATTFVFGRKAAEDIGLADFEDGLNEFIDLLASDLLSPQDDLIVRVNGVQVVPATLFAGTLQWCPANGQVSYSETFKRDIEVCDGDCRSFCASLGQSFFHSRPLPRPFGGLQDFPNASEARATGTYHPMFAESRLFTDIRVSFLRSNNAGAELQIIEYDSASVNDDLGSVVFRDESSDPNALAPINRDTVVVASTGEDGSVYEITYEVQPGEGTLEEIPERIICDTSTCIDSREDPPSDFRGIFRTFESDLRACPSGYLPAAGTYRGTFQYDGELWRVCELRPQTYPFYCGIDYTGLDEIGGADALEDGDLIVLEAVDIPTEETENGLGGEEVRYLSSRAGQYLSTCTGCVPGAGSTIPRVSANVHAIDPSRSGAQWRVKRLSNGTIALRGDNGRYLSRCNGCVPGFGGGDSFFADSAFASATDPELSFSQFTIAPADGTDTYTVQNSNGDYLYAFENGEQEKPGLAYQAFLTPAPTQWKISIRSPVITTYAQDTVLDSNIVLGPTGILVIGPGVEFMVPKGKTLRIPDGGAVENHGILIVDGTLLIDEGGEVNNHAAAVIVNEGTLRLFRGTLNNGTGAVIDNSDGDSIQNNAGTIVNEGGIYAPFGRYYGTAPVGNPVTDGFYLGPNIVGERSCGRLGGGWSEPDPTATPPEPFPVCTASNVWLRSGKTLKIASGVVLNLQGVLSSDGTIINDGVIDNSTAGAVIRVCGPPIDPDGAGTISDPSGVEDPCVKTPDQQQCEGYNGLWNPGGSCNFFSNSPPALPIEFGGEPLTIRSGVRWNVYGGRSLENSGTINIEEGAELVVQGGIFNRSFTDESGYGREGYINNYGSFRIEVDGESGIPGGVQNDGLINNFGEIDNGGNIVGSGSVVNTSCAGYRLTRYGDLCDDSSCWLPPFDVEGQNHLIDFPAVRSDFDSDGIDDECDPDDDNDGTADEFDAFPFDVTETTDADGDGVGDITDITLRSGVHLVIGVGDTFTVEAGETLRVTSGASIDNRGVFIVNGTLSIEQGGDFYNGAGGVIDNSDRGTIRNNGGTVSNDGAIYAPFGRYYGTAPEGNPLTDGYYLGPNAAGEKTCERLGGRLPDDWSEPDPSATPPRPFHECRTSDVWLRSDKSLTIASGVVLNLQGVLSNDGTIINDGVIDNSTAGALIRVCGTFDADGTSGAGTVSNPSAVEDPCVKTTNQQDCENYNGLWNGGGTCSFFSSSPPAAPIEFGDILTIRSGIRWNVYGGRSLENSGTINIEEGGELYLEGGVFNRSFADDEGYGREGYINNYGVFQIEVDGESGIPGGVQNDGIINNYGLLENGGNIVGSGSVSNPGCAEYRLTRYGSPCDDFTCWLPPFDAEGQYHLIDIPSQADFDSDGVADVCDSDDDGDGVDDELDAFPFDAIESTDTDLDGVGDVSDACPTIQDYTTDTDGDGICDPIDICANDPTNTVNSDTDDVCDDDDDFPDDGSETVDGDSDGVGDNADEFPANGDESKDTDGDGVGDNGDEFPNDHENTRLIDVDPSNSWSLVEGFFPDAMSVREPLPEGAELPLGLASLTLTGGAPGSTAVVTITYDAPLDPAMVWWKYGPTFSNPEPHWYVLKTASIEGAVVTLTLTDGGSGDSDLQEDGRITDPGGPGTPATGACSGAAGCSYLLGGPDASLTVSSADFSWDGGAWIAGYRTALEGALNFGAEGVVSRDVATTSLSSVSAETLAPLDGFIVPQWADVDTSASEATAVVDFFLAGGDLILLQEDDNHDAIGAQLGLPTSPSDGSASNGGAPLFDGPFGTALDVLQTTITGKLLAVDVASLGGTVAATNASGEITAALWDRGDYAPGAGRLLIVADVDMWATTLASYDPLNDNGTFALNGTAALVPEPSRAPLAFAALAALAAVALAVRVRARWSAMSS